MVKEVINDTSQVIGTTPSVVSKHVFNGQRAVTVLMNNSLAGQIISISIIGEAVAGKGIVLNVGDRYTASIDARYSPSNEQITAVASAAGAVLSLHEEIYLE